MRALITRAFAVAALVALGACASARPESQLAYEVYTASQRGYFVTSVIVYGPTEAVLIDAQFLQSDATRVADRIDALGRRLTAVIVTHPDADHYMGLATLHARFPEARLLMRPDDIPVLEEGVP